MDMWDYINIPFILFRPLRSSCMVRRLKVSFCYLKKGLIIYHPLTPLKQMLIPAYRCFLKFFCLIFTVLIYLDYI